MASTTISKALCGVMEQALIEKGIDATLAKALAERACEPALGAVPGAARKVGRAVRRTSKAANRKLSRALAEANRRLRKKNGQLKKGKTQGDVMRLAHRLKKKM